MTLLRSAFILALAASYYLPASAESAKQRGAAIFVDNGCQHCHTIRKVGGIKGPDLSGVGHTLNKAQIRTQILKGGREMPSFADILKATEVDDLVAYLHSCRDKKPKEP
ncbi:c-type cytochrome [Tunturiibacter gelidoferens]|uniref:Mono/diheme cytochrome c family protein n=1 Tax=Tunturiibacter gelidiferens TaxID=3069689 RepID=A0ACC5NZD3_9BACT|nr:cytochrome c [Edaphobacter lichenicola]MBB5339928.1 mono/diheme cytochrome c family protein [Edaphobacter lichenicola]